MRMMKILRTTLPAILLLTILSGSALAQTKIATVDLKKLFDGYYKTKLAQASIQESAAQLDRDDKGMKDDLKKGADDYQQLLQQASDQTLSADERARRQQAADDKKKQLQVNQASIDQYERQAQTTLYEKRQRMHDNIIIDIKAAVAVKAKLAGYSLVIDSTSDLSSGTPAVIYSNGDNDITASVLAQLNAGAPIDVTRPAAPTDAAPPLNGTGNP
jgi:outer membrane protein